MSNRRQRRAQRRAAPRRGTAAQRRTRFRYVVVFAVLGLIMLAIASLGAATVPAPSPTPIF